jgi:hypothetical protein
LKPGCSQSTIFKRRFGIWNPKSLAAAHEQDAEKGGALVILRSPFVAFRVNSGDEESRKCLISIREILREVYPERSFAALRSDFRSDPNRTIGLQQSEMTSEGLRMTA